MEVSPCNSSGAFFTLMPLFVTGKKHVAFSSYLFAQQPIIWCLLMHQKGSKAAVNKGKSVIKDNAEKEDTGTENMPDRH